MRSRLPRRGARFALLVAVPFTCAAVVVGEPATPAVAHATLAATAPTADSVVADAPEASTTSSGRDEVTSSSSPPISAPNTTQVGSVGRPSDIDRGGTATSIVFFAMTGGIAAVATVLVVSGRRRAGRS